MTVAKKKYVKKFENGKRIWSGCLFDMSLQDLPIELYDIIIDHEPDVYLGLLVVRKFVNSLIDCKITNYKKRFTIENEGKTYFRGKLHTFFDVPFVDEFGNKFWYKNGEYHRDNDLPAMIWEDGVKEWYQNGQSHRDNDLPAIEWPNGYKEWYKYGDKHRDGDLPAIEWPNGHKEWWYHGKFLRQEMV